MIGALALGAVGFGVLGFGRTASAADDPCADAAAATAWAQEVQALYEAGEAERKDRSATAVDVLARDEERVDAILKADKQGHLCSALAKWQAAWLLVQADDIDALERSYQLAQEAMKAQEPRGPWLVAFTFDRWRVAGGFRQSYGTQTQVNLDNHRCLVDVEPDVTDEERKTFGMPPIADTYRKILDQAGFTSDPPTLERLERHQLTCKPEAVTKKARRTVRPPE